MMSFWIIYTACLLGPVLGCRHEWVTWDKLGTGYRVFDGRWRQWEEAREFCETQNASLASLVGRGEQTFISEALLPDVEAPSVWVGGEDMQTEGQWRWLDNRRLMVKLFAWARGSPKTTKYNAKDCLSLTRATESVWVLADDVCSNNAPFICKRQGSGFTGIVTSSQSPAYKTSTEHKQRSQQQQQEVPTSVLVPVLGLLAALLATLSLIFIVLYIRQRSKSTTPVGLYERYRPPSAANEHLYQPCVQDTASKSSGIYEQLDTPEMGRVAGKVLPEVRLQNAGKCPSDSAYIDVRTANSINIWTVAK